MRNRVVHSSVLILMLAILAFGCGTTRSVYKKIAPEEVFLKKRVMVLPPIDHSGLPAGKAAELTSGLVEILKTSPNILIFDPPAHLSLAEEVKTTRFGVAHYDSQLMDTVKDANMNAVLGVYILPIEIKKGRKGIWPFRYDTEIFKMTIIVNVMDAANGCLYLTDLDAGQVVFKSKMVQGLSKEDLFVQTFDKTMPDILERQARDVENTLVEKSWTGEILELRGDQVVINAGQDVGVLPDQLFTVYEQGESILCKTGRSVELLGEKVGEVRVVTVMERSLLALPQTGGPFHSGQAVMFVREN